MFHILNFVAFYDNQRASTTKKKGHDRREIVLSKIIAEPKIATLDELIDGKDDRYNELASYLVREEILLGETTVTAGHVVGIVSMSFNGKTYRMSRHVFYEEIMES